MPGSSTRRVAQALALALLDKIAFRYTDSVGTRNQFSIAAQWLVCTFSYRRFADSLADARARLGADVVRYSFIVVDLQNLLLAGRRRLCVKTPMSNLHLELLPRLRSVMTGIEVGLPTEGRHDNAPKPTPAPAL